MRRITMCLIGSGLLLAAAGCASDGGSTQDVAAVADVTMAAPAASGDHSLFLRGEMNDYGVAEAYRLQEHGGDGLCALAALRADWSPYKFKFADEQWSPGYNYGYAAPPGTLRDNSSPVKLNPNSRFEDLRLVISEDGVYRFCLRKDGGTPYATVKLAKDVPLPPLLQAHRSGETQK